MRYAACCFPVLVLLALTAARPATAATLAEEAFQALRERPPAASVRFDFVVVGDTRSTEPVVLPGAFYTMIEEWNALAPGFVVDVGDLILGGAAEGLDPQWERFEEAVAQCEPPFFPVVGNHDVSDPETEAIYTERVGPLLYAFTYGNTRFIALNSEEQGQVHGLSESQRAWLRDDLEQATAENIVVFLHKPFFAMDWKKDWAETHAILKEHPVRLVVGSHWHLYRYWGARDGIEYVISGGGGAERRTPEEEGGFLHYLLVQVRGKDVDWVVMKPGSVLPKDTVTQAGIDELERLRAGIRTGTVEAPYGKPLEARFNVYIDNPLDYTIEDTLAWRTPKDWTVQPKKVDYSAPPGETTTLGFQVSVADPEDVGYPRPRFHTRIAKRQHGGPATIRTPIDLLRVGRALYSTKPMVIDGDLDEWFRTEPLPLPYAHAFKPKHTEDLDAQLRLMWNEKGVYLAVEVEDDEFHQPYAGDIVWSADNVQVFLDAWEWSLTLTEDGEEVFLYEGPGRESETMNEAVALAVKRDGRRTVYEAHFPPSEVAPLELAPENSFRFSVVVNDVDPSHPDRPRHWLQLTPCAGSGKDDFPMARFDLMPKPVLFQVPTEPAEEGGAG